MHSLDIILQDAAVGRVSEIAASLSRMAGASAFDDLKVAVAYATKPGCADLVGRFDSELTDWEEMPKRWMVSFDFGHTSPDALDFLSSLPNSEVRIPNGTVVIAQKLVPSIAFHPKAYLLSKVAKGGLASGLLLGSANLTKGALNTNAESGVLCHVAAPYKPADQHVRAMIDDFTAWWAEAWLAAEPLTPKMLKAYRQLRAARPRFPDSDKAALAIAAPTPTLTTPSKQSVLWANCAAFWIDAGTLSKNFGPGNPGNQLDCKRGTRVFFGFTHKDVPKNHIFGDVVIQVPGYVAQTRSVRFGNNSMDKVNLPVPDGITGPTSYDGKPLLFKRSGNQYVLTLGTAADRVAWRKRSKGKGLLYKVGKREFGFF